MNGTWRYLTPDESRASNAMSEVLKVGRLIDDSGEVCNCADTSDRGCSVDHDSMAEDLIAAIEHYVDTTLQVDPTANRGAILSKALESLQRLSRHVEWLEIIPEAMEREIHQHALRRMETHGLPQLSTAA